MGEDEEHSVGDEARLGNEFNFGLAPFAVPFYALRAAFRFEPAI
jgi:hypothetical protein